MGGLRASNPPDNLTLLAAPAADAASAHAWTVARARPLEAFGPRFARALFPFATQAPLTPPPPLLSEEEK